MSKICHWDEEKVKEEEGSVEIREFREDGKSCYYFCNYTCLVQWIKVECKTDIEIGDTN
jgi:hypothetical protein